MIFTADIVFPVSAPPVRDGYLEREGQGGTDYEASLRMETEEDLMNRILDVVAVSVTARGEIIASQTE